MTATEVLDALVALPISIWSYEWESDTTRHMGPMAQDFAVAFGLGDSEKSIAVVDALGVLMTAVQVLHRRIEELEQQRVAG